VIGRSEPDQEVQELLKASGGANLGMDFLPGAIGFDPVAHHVTPGLASRVLWLDAFAENVDRSWRNPNLLMWHGSLWLIDHGATLYFHHNWARAGANVHRPYPAADHVLRQYATELAEADAALAPQVTPELLGRVLAQVPGEWLTATDFADPSEAREAYVRHLLARLEGRSAWLPQAAAA
jgi:hypothetical protein